MPLLCIAGNHSICVEVLEAATHLVGVDIVCVPVSGDRGVDGWQPSVIAAARRLGIALVALEDLYGETDLSFLSIEYDRIVRPARFRQPDRLYNMHFSLLPHYRGCNTAIWPILNGETRHGVSLHVMDAGIDTGPIIAQRAFDIGSMAARDLFFTCMAAGRDLCIEWLPRLATGDVPAVPQDLSQGSLYMRRDLDFSRKVIDFDQTTDGVLNQIRAFTFPEYQLPLVDGRSIVDAWATSSADMPPEDDLIVRSTVDGYVALRITNTPPTPIALLERGL